MGERRLTGGYGASGRRHIADAGHKEHLDYHLATGPLPGEAADALKTRLVHHGVAANRDVLETLAQYSFEQGLTPRLMELDEIFAASTLDQ